MQNFKKQHELAFRSQKNETIGQLTGGMAHDFNNILLVISANLELLVAGDTTPKQSKSLQTALDATYRGSDLTSNMLAFARRAPLTPECFNLNDVVRDLRGWLERTLPATVEIKFFWAEDLRGVRIDRNSDESALLNLIVIARDAMNERGLLTIDEKPVHRW